MRQGVGPTDYAVSWLGWGVFGHPPWVVEERKVLGLETAVASLGLLAVGKPRASRTLQESQASGPEGR